MTTEAGMAIKLTRRNSGTTMKPIRFHSIAPHVTAIEKRQKGKKGKCAHAFTEENLEKDNFSINRVARNRIKVIAT